MLTFFALEPFKASTREKTLKNISDVLVELNFNALKRKMSAIFTNCLEEINDSLEEFKSDHKLTLDLTSGKTITYTPEIRRRTLMTFAEAVQQCNDILLSIRKSINMQDLLETFISIALDKLENKTYNNF